MKYTDSEKQINTVLAHHQMRLSNLNAGQKESLDSNISSTEEILRDLGIALPQSRTVKPVSRQKQIIEVPSWEEMCDLAEKTLGANVSLESLFSKEELNNNIRAIALLNEDYKAIHKLDAIDISICAAAAILGSIIDILLVGIPQKTSAGLKGGPLSNYVRDWFDKRFPEQEMERLANSTVSKVPFDAQDNRNTTIRVEGLSAYYHRLLSLGHDPLLGFMFGVFDIINGTMTTIDKKGNLVVQIMENYAERKRYLCCDSKTHNPF